MRSINIIDFSKVGQVIKTHGNKGFLKIALDKNIKIKEWVMFLIKQKPVPFFITEWQRTTNTEAIIKCGDIQTVDAAEDFIGLDILLPSSTIKIKKDKININFIGFTLMETSVGELGTLLQIIDMPGQTMFQTLYKEQQIMIPAVDEFIVEINEANKIITLQLPDGFLELNA